MRLRALAVVVGVALALVLALPASADWDLGEPFKWLQFPDLEPTGIDVNATHPSLLADDFECTQPGPITDIHIWGSWLDDILPQGVPEAVVFTLSIHEDIPAEASPTGYSMPGEILWVGTFSPGEFAAREWATGLVEGWLDPPDSYMFPADTVCWQYNFFVDPLSAFYQEGTPTDPIVYWLDVQAAPLDPSALFGWKTSRDQWNDAAVWGVGEEPYVGDWGELRFPPSHAGAGEKMDLAFVITGEPGSQELDWGDAPDPTYPTLAASFGANHVIVPGISLGATIDAEIDGQPDGTATGDDLAGIDDEDGVIFTSAIVPGGPATVDVTVTVPGMIDAWIDFGGDGSWAEAGDQIFASEFVGLGTTSLTFIVPVGAAPGATFARFRFSTAGGLPFGGPAPDGEVEDYEAFIEEDLTYYKWIQNPDLSTTGIDVNAADPYVLADDFLCTESGPITDVHIWGSWLNDVLPPTGPGGATFILSIHDDIPAGAGGVPYSMPGELLWLATFGPGDYEVELYADGLLEGWLNPPDGYTFPGDTQCWLYNFYIDPAVAFQQQGTATNPIVYWLDLQVVPDGTPAHFGWKTSLEHWNDDAVYGLGVEPFFGPWMELIYPPNHPMMGESIDLAFAITGEPPGGDELDWGDAPDPTYPTLAASFGANHVIVPGFNLGATIDAEIDGQPDGTATGDDLAGIDDEDGVIFTSALTPGMVASVDVTASAGGMLDAWMDFGGDGSWAEAGDQFLTGELLVAGLNSISFVVPVGATPGTTFARFRFSTVVGGLPYDGPAPDGEVEDYEVFIEEDLTYYKWIQNPDLSTTGIDVNATDPYVLADDFNCTQSGPITDIHIWGSWLNDVLPPTGPGGATFTLSIHEDIPAGPGVPYSMPGELLWLATFGPGDYDAQLYADGLLEGWMDPPDYYIFPGDTQCWLYNFYIDPAVAFYQEGTAANPVVYWLDLQVTPEATPPAAQFGWKTSLEHWNDDAVYGLGVEPFFGPWMELIYPPNHPMMGESIDLAFAITGEPPGGEELDWGDAPDPTYPTLAASTGANHVIVPGIFLGAAIDAEIDGQPDGTATGDDLAGIDDEDGVIFTSALLPGMGGSVDVTASVGGMLDAWIDFGGDGSWAEPGDQIFAGDLLVAGLNSLTFPVPIGATPGVTFARFRFSTVVGGLPYDGPAPDGEVEDYEVFIEEGHTYKWIQNPDLTTTGIDINAMNQFILADDFLCTQAGPITDVHIWGSWLDDLYPLPPLGPSGVTFTLSLHADIPADESPTGYSMPGDVLWVKTFAPGEFDVVLWADGLLEGWMDPPDAYIFPGDTECWLYTFLIDPAEAFYQEGSAVNPIVYWLDLQAESIDGATSFGWKTSREHWNDDAVYGIGNEPYLGPWYELIYPPDHPVAGESIDLAFAITGEPVEAELDWGDAPDPTYPTLAASTGANHVIVPGIFLGAAIDAELNGQPDGTATGDDLAGIDDEDGVIFTSALLPGMGGSVDVTASVPGMLDAWIDFGSDGSWAEAGDQIFASEPLVAGLNSLTFVVPVGAAPGTTFARFRFSTVVGGLPYSGPAPNGEVEDYEVLVEEGHTYKWIQNPDLSTTGIDVNATHSFILADDFECTVTGPLTDIHVWGSWLNDVLPVMGAGGATFTLSLHADIPAGPGVPYSMPGDMLWLKTFLPGEYDAVLWADGLLEGWMDPPDGYLFPGDTQCWLYTFLLDPADWFYQTGTPATPVVYWLDLQVYPDPVATFGWKTSLEHWNDDAVFGIGNEPHFSDWFELIYPPDHPMMGESIDLAFAITGEPGGGELDWGDAPDPTYPTLAGSGGANHFIVPGVFLGAAVDAELNGQPDGTATGDDLAGIDDEDGVIFTSALLPGMGATVDVTASVDGVLDAWIDFGGDGSWAEPGDQIFAGEPLVAGVNSLSFVVPIGAAPGVTFSRFRFNTAVALPYGGPASNGEVEDHRVSIEQGHTYKWIQNPDLSTTGMDVNATQLFILADDFHCTQTGPLTDVHVWGSWLNDILPPAGPGGVAFTLSIHADIPAGPGVPYSMPGDILWLKTFHPGEYDVVLYADGLIEGWFDPPNGYIFPGDTKCWLYTFLIDAAEAFYQLGTPALPVVYWLDLQVEQAGAAHVFGWKTSLEHWNDDAVYGNGLEPYFGPWFELVYPLQHPMAGESIDLAFAITGEPGTAELDWGDAPDPTYPTLAASNGARHVIVPALFMGAAVDAEIDGQPNATATGDDAAGIDDEDGVLFTTALVPGQPAGVDVTASAAGMLDAWLDFGGDGSWAEAGDQIFASQPLAAGLNSLTFVVPAGSAAGQTVARFRFSTAGGLSYDGPASDGEVEDHRAAIQEGQVHKWIQYPDLNPTGIDVNAVNPFILADDWLCEAPGRITEIYVWGSWLNDEVPTAPFPFTLSIHSDIPEDQSPTGYSMPGDVLWHRTFMPPQYDVEVWMDGLVEGWLDPPDGYVFPADTICWLYTFHITAAEAFHQVGTPANPVVYWLDLQVPTEFPGMLFGWKTTLDHWNDDAVWGVGSEPYGGPWEELRYPQGHPFFQESIDLAFGIETTHGTGVPEDEVPEGFGLRQNVPNPFNPVTTIAYEVPAGGGRVTLQVFDVGGRLVATLVDGAEPEGERSVTWRGVDEEGRELPSGVYFYRLVAPGYETTRKMLLLK